MTATRGCTSRSTSASPAPSTSWCASRSRRGPDPGGLRAPLPALGDGEPLRAPGRLGAARRHPSRRSRRPPRAARSAARASGPPPVAVDRLRHRRAARVATLRRQRPPSSCSTSRTCRWPRWPTLGMSESAVKISLHRARQPSPSCSTRRSAMSVDNRLRDGLERSASAFVPAALGGVEPLVSTRSSPPHRASGGRPPRRWSCSPSGPSWSWTAVADAPPSVPAVPRHLGRGTVAPSSSPSAVPSITQADAALASVIAGEWITGLVSIDEATPPWCAPAPRPTARPCSPTLRVPGPSR